MSTVQVFLLVCLVSGLDAQLTCPCEGPVCSTGQIKCGKATEICYRAVLESPDGTIKKEAGCKEQNLCTSTDGCQGRGEQFCAKFGCCSTNLCTANYTMGEDFKTTSSSTAMLKSSPTPAVQPSSPAVQPSSPVVQPSSQIVQPSSPAVQPSSSAAPMTTKPEMAATSSIKPEMAATSSIPEKMTSKPIMPTAKMSKVNPMTSSKPEVKPTGSKEDMMSSSGKEMKPSAVSRDGVHSTEILVILPTVDDRPTCAGSGQVLATFVVVAIALLCSIF